MKRVEDERYQLMGQIAIALYSQEIRISLSSLKSILMDYGYDYSSDYNRGLAKSVASAYSAWEKTDPVIHHAIAYTFTDQNGELPWDK